MSDALWMMLAMALSLAGMTWLALAMETHWEQAMLTSMSKKRSLVLRCLGGLGLASSLLACLAADQASMAMLMWVMLLATGSTGVALILAHRPSLLRFLWP